LRWAKVVDEGCGRGIRLGLPGRGSVRTQGVDLGGRNPKRSFYKAGATREVAQVRIDPARVRAILTSNGMLAFLGAVFIAVLVAQLYGH
jgi:hypothetical protein